VLSATLLRVPGGEEVTRVNVEGAPDSLAWLVDRLAARLLTEVSGEGEQRAAGLTSTSLDALRAYLDGQAKLRRGQVQAAAEEFTRALDADSNFALAGIGLHQASSWYGDANSQERGLRLAWRGRDRLGPRDQALLAAVAGPDFPRRSPTAEVLRARERYLNIAPDRPDAWYLLGDHLFHFGQIYDIENYRRRALDAFRRASELDSTYVVPFIHGVDLAVLLDDTATARRFERLRLAADTSRTWMVMHRWFVAAHGGDTVRARAIRDSLIGAQDQLAFGVGQHAFYDGVGATDIPVVLDAFEPLARERGGAIGYNRLAHDALLILGRPTAARARVDSMFTQDAELNALIVRVRDALVGGADSADGGDAARALAARVRVPMPNDSVRRIHTRAILRVLEPWRLAQGDTSTARRTIEELDLLSRGDSSATTTDALMDVAVIRAMYADATRKPTARAELERLDSLMRVLDYQGAHPGRTQLASLVAARLFERAGDPQRALGAVQRRGDMWTNGLLYLPAQLREEGRLAARVGKREQAIAAYRHYLALRFDPEPRLRDEAAQVRRELAALEREREGR
jgi:serine/threonine-protein kinase